VCQEGGKGEREDKIFSNGISVGYKYDLNSLNDLNVARVPWGRSMKFLTTFLGKVLPLSGKHLHTFHHGGSEDTEELPTGFTGFTG